MTTHLTRLVFVFGLALVASVVRGQNSDTTAANRDAARPQWAGFGLVSLAETQKPDSIRIIESDEEVIVVDTPSASNAD